MSTLCTAEGLADTLGEVYRRVPGALLVGSLGRAAYVGDAEFRARGEHPLYRANGQPRDIDLLVPRTLEQAMFEDLSPFKVDVCYQMPEIAIGTVDSFWVVQSRMYRPDPVVLDDEVVRPISASTVYGIDCLVPPIETLYCLAGIINNRPKDEIARALLAREMGGAVEGAVYEPLSQLFGVEQHRSLDAVSGLYGKLIPRELRRRIRPMLLPTRRALIRLSSRSATKKKG